MLIVIQLSKVNRSQGHPSLTKLKPSVTSMVIWLIFCFFFFFLWVTEKDVPKWKKMISPRVWYAKHPFAGRNTQHPLFPWLHDVINELPHFSLNSHFDLDLDKPPHCFFPK